MTPQRAGNRKRESGGRPRRGLRRLSLLLLVFGLVAPAVAQEVSYDLEDPESYQDGSEPELEYYDRESVVDASERVLSRPEFRGVPPLKLGPDGANAEPLKSKEELRREREVEIRGPSVGTNLFANLFGGVVSMAVVLVLAVVIAAIVGLIVFGLRGWERAQKEAAKPDGDAASDDEPEAVLTPGDKPADAWLVAARAAAAAGRFDEALSLLLLGAMAYAERSGLIRPRRGLTYRDYLRAVPDSSAWHAALDRLIRTYAPIGFGRREATAAAFEAAVAPYEHALAAEPPRLSPHPGEKSRGE